MGVLLTGQTNRDLLANLERVRDGVMELTRRGVEVRGVTVGSATCSISLAWDDFCRMLPGATARRRVLNSTVHYTARGGGIEYSAFRDRLPGEREGVEEVTL